MSADHPVRDHAARVSAAVVSEVREAARVFPGSRAELAAAAKMSRTTLTRRLAGEHVFYVEELVRLGNVLGFRLSDLMERAERAVTEGAR